MNKLAICLLVLAFAAVYVDCASVKNQIPYAISMQRFRDNIKVYQTRFPDSQFVNGLLTVLSDPSFGPIPFLPYVMTVALHPAIKFTLEFFGKIQNLIKYLSINPANLHLNKLGHLITLFQIDETPENLGRMAMVGKPILDSMEHIDWSLLFNFAPNVPDHVLKILGMYFTDLINRGLDALGEVKTLEDLASLDYTKFSIALNNLLA